MTPRELADEIKAALDSKNGRDIELLEVGDKTVLAEYFVICTGTSSTHINTLAETCEFQMKNKGEPVRHTEGFKSGTWVLLDFGSVIAHIFTQETRDFYKLDKLWTERNPNEV